MDLLRNATLTDLESLRLKVSALQVDQQDAQSKVKNLENESARLSKTVESRREKIGILNQEMATVVADPSLINDGRVYTPVIIFGVVVFTVASAILFWIFCSFVVGSIIATLFVIPAGVAANSIIKRILVPQPYLSVSRYQGLILEADSDLQSAGQRIREINNQLGPASKRLSSVTAKLNSYPSIKQIDERARAIRAAALEKERLNRERLRLQNVDWRDYRGIPFEEFIAEVLRLFNFKVTITKASGDQGVDLIAERDGERIAIQCKGYANAVGNYAVQEVHTGKAVYKCPISWCVTNSYFTPSAQQLALTVSCRLIDGNEIQQILAGQKTL
jgi:HJR/Mrr/RecB family endonuclease